MESGTLAIEGPVGITATVPSLPTTCYMVRVSTGCTCCSNDNFIEGPWRSKEAAEKQAETHLKYGTLRSQFAERGCADIIEMPCEIAGSWIILDGQYAVKGPFLDDQEEAYPEPLSQFDRDYRL